MEAQLKVSDLHRLAKNALLYSSKGSEAHGETLWAWGAWGLRVIASDDYVILTDTMEMDFALPGWGILEYDYLKEMEKQLREWPEATIDGKDISWTDMTDPQSELLYQADLMVFSYDTEKKPPIPLLKWAVSPDRLRKMSLIKPGDLPVDLMAFDVDGDDMVGFKVGPTVRGLIAPLNRQKLKELVPEGSLW